MNSEFPEDKYIRQEPLLGIELAVLEEKLFQQSIKLFPIQKEELEELHKNLENCPNVAKGNKIRITPYDCTGCLYRIISLRSDIDFCTPALRQRIYSELISTHFL